MIEVGCLMVTIGVVRLVEIELRMGFAATVERVAIVEVWPGRVVREEGLLPGSILVGFSDFTRVGLEADFAEELCLSCYSLMKQQS